MDEALEADDERLDDDEPNDEGDDEADEDDDDDDDSEASNSSLLPTVERRLAREHKDDNDCSFSVAVLASRGLLAFECCF